MIDSPAQMLSAERLQRASGVLSQNLGSAVSGLVDDGYWIDDHRFFFAVAEVVEGVQRRVPTLADAHAGTVAPVLQVDAIAALISAHGATGISANDLSGARYEMPDARTLVVVSGLDAWRLDLGGPTFVEAVKLEPVMALRSPDGRHACFLRGDDVWVKDVATGAARPVTTDGEPHWSYGATPESGIAPLSARKQRVPMGLWSADSQWFVTHRIDERALSDGGLVEHAPTGGGRPVSHVFKVADADAEPARAEFVAWHLPTGRIVRSGDTTTIVAAISPFMTRQCWVTGNAVWFLSWDRFSSTVSLIAMSLDTGATRIVLTEGADSGWIDLHPFVMGQPLVRPLPASGELVWYSAADGRGHLYLHDIATGTLKNRITDGPWVVRELVHVDEANRRILFLASGFDGDGDPVNRRLCAVNFDGSGLRTIFAADGDLAVKPEPMAGIDQIKPYRPSYARSGASSDGRHVAAILGSVDVPTRWLLIDTDIGDCTELARVDIEAHWPGPKPQPFEALAADGKTRLFGALYLPTDFDPAASYPLVDYIYPGPQLNLHARRFPSGMALLLKSVVELGMAGLILESRGLPNRDRAFHQAGQGRELEPQLSDHAAVIEQLCQRHSFLDRTRIGILGQSGGGHATARALFDYPGVFKAGVAASGNHDSRHYVAHWIDKYGGRPGTPERDAQANTSAAHKLQGQLLLMHGDMDENVHPGHTLALAGALVAAGKPFDMLILPGVTHGIFSESPYAVQRTWSHFARHLLGVELPADFKLAWPPAGRAAATSLQANDFF